jgi:hypothetical protein
MILATRCAASGLSRSIQEQIRSRSSTAGADQRTSSGLKKSSQPFAYLGMRQEFASLKRSLASLYSFHKAIFLSEVTSDNILYNFAGVAAMFCRALRKAGLEIGTKLDFHRCNDRLSIVRKQSASAGNALPRHRRRRAGNSRYADAGGRVATWLVARLAHAKLDGVVEDCENLALLPWCLTAHVAQFSRADGISGGRYSLCGDVGGGGGGGAMNSTLQPAPAACAFCSSFLVWAINSAIWKGFTR